MQTLLHKALIFAEQGLEFVGLATMMAGASLPHILSKKGGAHKEAFAYLISSHIFSIVAGLVATNTPYLEDFSWLVSSLAYVFGATTYSLVMEKNIFEVLSMYTKANEGKDVESSED